MEHCSCLQKFLNRLSRRREAAPPEDNGETRAAMERSPAWVWTKITLARNTCEPKHLCWWSFASSHWCSWRRSWRNQGCKVSVISGWVTPFLRRFFPWCRLHKRLVISIIRDNGMIPLRKASIIFVFMHVLCMSWICWVFALTWQRLHVSLGDQIAHATWSLPDAQDSSSPTQYVPFWII